MNISDGDAEEDALGDRHTRSRAQMSPSITTSEADDAEHCEEICHGTSIRLSL